jgi:hypothetical protein
MICFSELLNVFRPSFEVVKEGRIFLTEKMSWKYPSHAKEPSEIRRCGEVIGCYLILN